MGTYKERFLSRLSTPTLYPFFRIDLHRLFVEHAWGILSTKMYETINVISFSQLHHGYSNCGSIFPIRAN